MPAPTEIGSLPPANTFAMSGLSRQFRPEAMLLRLCDVKRERQPSLVVRSPTPATDASATIGLVAIECPAKRHYSFDTWTTGKNKINPESVSKEERTFAKNSDGRFVTEGSFFTTENTAPGRIFHITNPRFIPGKPLKVDNIEAGHRVIDTTEFSGTPLSMTSLFFQCSNLNCGRRIAGEAAISCGKCGSASTTRYCTYQCQWNDMHHWTICGDKALVTGNVFPRGDFASVLNARQTFKPSNIDGWRQQVSHTTCPGSYSLFMLVNDGLGPAYSHTYQVGFPPGWEGNSFAFLTRLAIDMGHITAIRLLFRWIKRQIKRKAPVAWTDETFFSYVQAVYDQMISEFGEFWAEGESFGGLDDISSPGSLDKETVELMYREAWRIIEQDIPGFIRPHGCWVPLQNTPVPAEKDTKTESVTATKRKTSGKAASKPSNKKNVKGDGTKAGKA
ncbi:hypothetical protein ABW21_db0208145 [Orbilia brochopaga]|nr:hypothetical protein ABW21_db0208145 [Drechslerella brochopaga]